MATGAIARPGHRPREYTGLLGWVFTTDHKKIGMMYLLFTVLFLFVGGILALLVRLQLAASESSILSQDHYNQVFTMHGSTMLFLFVIPLAAIVMFSSFFVEGGAAQAGWTEYPPLTSKTFLPGHGTDLWILGVQILGISSVGGSINFLVTAMTMRAPGMTLNRQRRRC